MKIVKKKLSDLRLIEKNVRRHPEKQISEYVRSLEMFGQVKPLVIDETGEIIAGNGLFLALQKMGSAECDCYIMEGLTDVQKKKLMLADNRVFELGITDTDAFEEIVKELGGDVDVPGWDKDLLEMMNAAAADVDEMVTGYGSFSDEDIGKVQEKPAADTGSTQAQPAQSQPTEDNAPAGAEVQRTIVCPKCGERICL